MPDFQPSHRTCLPVCPYCRKVAWYLGNHRECARDMKRIDKMCRAVIRKTQLSLTEAKSFKLYSRLSNKVLDCYLVRYRQVNPSRLLRHGWVALVDSLFRLGDPSIFASNRTGTG